MSDTSSQPDRQQAGKNAQVAQVVFLRTLRRECLDKASVVVRLVLVTGEEVRGKLEAFDLHCVILHTRRRRYMIYKHAIVAICRSTRNRKGELPAGQGSPADTVAKSEALPAADSPQ